MLRELGDTSGLTLLVGLLSLGLVVFLKERAPAIPGSLAAVLFGIAAVAVFDLDQHGVAIVGNIDGGLPSLGLPDAGLGDYLDLGAVAFGVMFVGFAEGIGAAKTYATRFRYEIDREPRADRARAANIASGAFQRHGRQREPLEDCGQRRIRGRSRSCRALSSQPSTVLTLLVLHRGCSSNSRGARSLQW